MFGLLSLQPKTFLMSADDLSKSAGGGGNTMATTNTSSPPPTQNFDLSVLSGLKPSDKYLGKNRVSDIQEAYQTYVTGNPIGRGGQYAVDSAKKYGVSIVEAARGYLQGVGLPILSNATTQSQTQTQTQSNDTTKTDTTVVQQKNPFEILADILPNLFGNAVYNPPLQSQAYGYSPTTTEQPLTQSGGGSNIGLLIILGVVGVIGYFVYKRFVK
jgi:hypothetical protein